MNIDAIHPREKMEESKTSNNNLASGTVQMKRGVGLVRGVALIVGAMIGSGIFISPKGILVSTQSVGMSLIVWVICAFVSALGAMCYAELGAVVPQSGAKYQYVLHAYGDLPAFLVALSDVAVVNPSAQSLVSITLGTYMADYITPGECPPPVETVKLFAILAIMTSIFINCVSVRLSTAMSVVFTTGKVLALIVIIVTGLVKLAQGATQYLDPTVSFEGSSTQVFSYGMAFYNGFWAYSGWEILNSLPEEMHNPARHIPLALVISISAVTVIYLLTNIAYFTILSPAEVLASSAVAVTFAERTLGPMAWLVPVGVCISVFGNQLGGTLACSRDTFAAAREGHMLRILSMVSVRWLTPLPAIVFQGALGIIYTFLGDFNSILLFLNLFAWAMNGAVFMAVLVLRRKYPNRHRPFKVPVVVPILATLVSVFMMIAPLISDPSLEYLYGLIVLSLCLLVYVVFIWGKRQLPFMNKLTLFFQKLFLVGPTRN